MEFKLSLSPLGVLIYGRSARQRGHTDSVKGRFERTRPQCERSKSLLEKFSTKDDEGLESRHQEGNNKNNEIARTQ